MKNFTLKNLYDAKGIGDDGQPIRKLALLYTDGKEDSHLCDCCDEKKPCAHFDDLTKNVSVVCKDCLQLLVDSFNHNENDV